MQGGGRQSAELVGKIFGVDVSGLRDGFVFYLYGEEGCAGDRGGAALTEEAGFGDAAGCGIQARCEVENVTADGIGDVNARGGVGKFSGVARGLEVVEDGGAEHVLVSQVAHDSGNRWTLTRVKKV